MMAVIIPTYYVGVGVGFNLGPALAPYVRYRHTFLGVKDTGDADEDGDFNLNEINGWGQAIVGCEIRMNKVAIIPEVSWVQDLESDTGEQLQTFSLGIRFASF
jgi:hypothetical protein